jgi:hypothetical protein
LAVRLAMPVTHRFFQLFEHFHYLLVFVGDDPANQQRFDFCAGDSSGRTSAALEQQ